jgi:hypothetical protein
MSKRFRIILLVFFFGIYLCAIMIGATLYGIKPLDLVHLALVALTAISFTIVSKKVYFHFKLRHYRPWPPPKPAQKHT